MKREQANEKRCKRIVIFKGGLKENMNQSIVTFHKIGTAFLSICTKSNCAFCWISTLCVIYVEKTAKV